MDSKYGYVFPEPGFVSSDVVDGQGYGGIYHRTGRDTQKGGYWISSMVWSTDAVYPACIGHASGVLPILTYGFSTNLRGISPVISLKSDFIIKI